MGFTCGKDPDYVWSSSAITVRVPSTKDFSRPAGSGFFRVITISNDTCWSKDSIDVRYSVANFRDGSDRGVRIHMGDESNMSRYEWLVDSTFAREPDALKTTQEAICDWNRATTVNWSYQGVSPLATPAIDGINVIYSADSSAFSGALSNAAAYTENKGSRTETCLNLSGRPLLFYRDLDIVVRQDPTELGISNGWLLDNTMTPDSNQLDFYSVILHELGHAHHLKHVIPDSRMMYYRLDPGITKRTITGDEIAGGIDILDESARELVGGCPTPVSKGVIICITPVKDKVQNIGIKVYPNPVINNQVQIELPDFIKNSKVQVSLYDSRGKMLFQSLFSEKINTVTLPHLHNGIYFLTSSVEDGRKQVNKIVITQNN